MSKKLGVLLAAIMGLALAAVGCGGGDEASGGSGGGEVTVVTTSSLSKPQFVKKVNGFCTREQKQLYKEDTAYLTRESKGARPSDAIYKASLNTVLLPGFESQVERIRRMGAPQGDEEEVEAFLNSWQQAIDAGKKLPPSNTVNLQRLLVPSGELAGKYGVAACAFP